MFGIKRKDVELLAGVIMAICAIYGVVSAYNNYNSGSIVGDNNEQNMGTVTDIDNSQQSKNNLQASDMVSNSKVDNLDHSNQKTVITNNYNFYGTSNETISKVFKEGVNSDVTPTSALKDNIECSDNRTEIPPELIQELNRNKLLTTMYKDILERSQFNITYTIGNDTANGGIPYSYGFYQKMFPLKIGSPYFLILDKYYNLKNVRLILPNNQTYYFNKIRIDGRVVGICYGTPENPTYCFLSQDLDTSYPSQNPINDICWDIRYFYFNETNTGDMFGAHFDINNTQMLDKCLE